MARVEQDKIRRGEYGTQAQRRGRERFVHGTGYGCGQGHRAVLCRPAGLVGLRYSCGGCRRCGGAGGGRDLAPLRRAVREPYLRHGQARSGRGFCLRGRAERGIAVDVLVNNAGIFSFLDVLSTPVERIRRIVLLHDMTTTTMCRLYGEEMARRGGGRILNMSSYSIWMPFPGLSLYSASKGLLEELFGGLLEGGARARRERYGRMSCGHSDRSVRAVAALAEDRAAAGYPVVGRQLCATRPEGHVERTPVRGARLVVPPVHPDMPMYAASAAGVAQTLYDEVSEIDARGIDNYRRL